MHKGYDAADDHMRGTGRSYDFFGAELINRCDGWSIPFQTPHNEPKNKRINMCREVLSDERGSLFLVFGQKS